MKELYLIGYASGAAGADSQCDKAPSVIQQSPYLAGLIKQGIKVHWDSIIHDTIDTSLTPDELIAKVCEKLAIKTAALVTRRQVFTVIGGDHASAIGTWSGVYDALHRQGDLGLIWIDAHLDSHTPETTESGRIHGMPLAVLLGYGYPTLTSILNVAPKIKPENICVIGVRSFESAEAHLLKDLNVRIYGMEEVNARGFKTVLLEAVQHIKDHTIAYGLSLDMDAVDPNDAPGVDVPVSQGIHATDLLEGLSGIVADPRLIATEIVEFDPLRDVDQKTEKLVVAILEKLAN